VLSVFFRGKINPYPSPVFVSNISQFRLRMFEKSPALPCRASARHPFQEIPRFTRDDKKEGRDDKKEGSE